MPRLSNACPPWLRPRTRIVGDPGHPPRALTMFLLTVLELMRWNGLIGMFLSEVKLLVIGKQVLSNGI